MWWTGCQAWEFGHQNPGDSQKLPPVIARHNGQFNLYFKITITLYVCTYVILGTEKTKTGGKNEILQIHCNSWRYEY